MTDSRQPAVDRAGAAQVIRRPRRCSTAIDLTVAEGTIFALLGPNGAGKTTMVRILSTLIPADSGDVRVAGHDVVDRPGRGARRRSASPASSRRWTNLLTGEENLR